MKNHVLINSRWVLHTPFQRGGSPFWVYKVRDTWPDGKTHFFSTREKEQRKARQAVQRWIEDQEELEKGKAKKTILFGEAFTKYLELKSIRQVTRDAYETDFEGIYKPSFGAKYVHMVRLEDIQKFMKMLEDQRGASARTRKKHLIQLRSFFRWAFRLHYTLANPCEGERVARGTKREPRALTLEERRQLIAATRKPVVLNVKDKTKKRGKWDQRFDPPSHLFLVCLIGLHAGLRRKNITGLRWGQVDLSKRRISIAGAEMKGHDDIVLPIHPELVEVLEGLLKDRKGVPNADALVVGRSVDRLDDSFKSALKRAGLPETIRLHDFRHSFGTALETKCSFSCLRELMGHSPGPSVTLGYLHPSWEEKVAAIESLPRLLSEESLANARAGKAVDVDGAGGSG